MGRRNFTGGLLMAPGVLLSSGCAAGNNLSRKPQTDQELKGMGYIAANDQIDPLPIPPDGLENVYVNGITDIGAWIFSTWFGKRRGGVSIFGGATFPRWVKVTYRAPSKPNDPDYLDPRIDPWLKGKVLAEYHIEVLSRIPEDVFNFTFAKRGRAIRLKFRIKVDGVLFGWDVQDMYLEIPDSPIKYAMMGGDFLDNMGRPFRPGQLIDTTKE